ncbi:4Fe-4S dicluster domain-containing protein [Rubripirellula reticaptiva]|uniref:Quinol dehydrogenase periplasmic component n=1 Tax=Rubripirellula reticaptiva TaxID=2528013 RepID=A0A5C6EI36_9BACT|nr:4Fe-4S dicluster domain-containing protein [Rubripirellula reticaptiva]TWU46909.1 quinol dehydrogenase periplasmic component [Rubripirellula reticaptiva]
MPDKNERPKINRRDLLKGRLWKLISVPKLGPLIARYPKADSQDSATSSGMAATKSIGGISIEAVAPTNLAGKPASPSVPVFRPPGAIAEPQFLAGCTRCGDCVSACPYDAIRNASDRLRPIAGTPIIEADTSACMMCEDFPCITACKPGVLVDSIPKVMGTAMVTQHLCLAHHGTTCTACSERCPVADAINVTEGKPTVNEDTCTGCGVCRYVCPAPENAILLMPTFSRPSV